MIRGYANVRDISLIPDRVPEGIFQPGFANDMSLVGRRPEDPRYVALYTSEQRRALNVRPGITSPASMSYRDEEGMLRGADWERTYCTEVLPAKLAIDLAYLSRRTLFSDVGLILRTLFSMFRQNTS